MKMFLEFADFQVVSIHGLFGVVLVFIDSIDYYRKVTIDQECLNSMRGGYRETMYEGFILDLVVCCLPEDLEHVY